MVTTIEPKSTSQRVQLLQQSKSLAVVLREEFGVPFKFYDTTEGQLIWDTEPEDHFVAAPDLDSETALALAACGEHLSLLDDRRYQLMIPLFDPQSPVVIAVGALPALAHLRADRVQEQLRLKKWIQSVAERLRNHGQVVHRQATQNGSDAQPGQAWNSLLTLDKLLHRLRIHKDPAKYRQRILDAAAELLNVQTLFWVSPRGEEPVIAGDPCLSPWDCQQLTMQIAKGMSRDETGVRVCNDVQEQTWASRCKSVSNLLVVALQDQRLGGWAIALNKLAPRVNGQQVRSGQSPECESGRRAWPAGGIETIPFRRSDAALLTPFLSLLGLYSSASHRFHTLKELMVGLARSLTASIDAKDEYTFGHSERVARISMELGSELGLGDDELNDIYLAGLLHDIGKIGVPDAVLRKPGALTFEETLQIQQHVTIGYKILSGLRPIAHLLPGVLYHHERYDGTGYPEGLKGEAIPMLARIIAVADGYDAMSSSRPYREGMPLDKVEEILAQGAGTQWDANVIQAFLRRRQRIHAIRHRGIGESLRNALDGAIREKDDSESGSSVAPLLMP